jgi:hypothetical protein
MIKALKHSKSADNNISKWDPGDPNDMGIQLVYFRWVKLLILDNFTPLKILTGYYPFHLKCKGS